MPKYNDFELDLQKTSMSKEPSIDTSGTNFCTKLSYDCPAKSGARTVNRENY